MSEQPTITPRTDWTYTARLECGATLNYDNPPNVAAIRMLPCPKHGIAEFITQSWWPASAEGVTVLGERP